MKNLFNKIKDLILGQNLNTEMMENQIFSESFWDEIAERNKPFFVLAPMADVTDVAFRQIIAKYSRHGQIGGGPDVFWTEFVSADGLCHPVARERLAIDLKYEENERPIIAQIFGSNLKNIEQASRYCFELGFDGIDLNMGCPDRSIEKQGSGAGHLKSKKHAVEVIKACIKGASGLPVSVKTRVGYNSIEIEEWIPMLLRSGIRALTIHARTRKEMSLVPANWDLVRQVVQLRDKIAPKVLIIGNGDVDSLEKGIQRQNETGCDGIMIGRGIFGNPWLFDADKKEISIKEKLEVMMEHTELFEKLLGGYKNFYIMKKHYKAYVNNFDGAKELRVKLMEAENFAEVRKITEEFLGNL